MKLIIELMVLLMTIPVFAQIDNWDKFNSSVLIEVTRPNGVFTCSGVAVASRTIVTAAHCLEGSIKSVRVFTQASYDPEQSSLSIKEFKLHPNYDSGTSRYRSDIAKINLKDKLPPFIRIHQIHQGKKIFGNIYRFGFGQRNSQNVRTVVTPTLRKINIEEDVLELDDEFSKSGDSGGPIFLENGKTTTILAIHSTFSHGPEGFFSLNPMLEAYIPWIFEN
jgi:secreted trypsin-like serine protease